MYRFLIFIIISILVAPALSAMRVSGSLNIASPVEISVTDIAGTKLLSVMLQRGGSFSSPEIDLLPDVYVFGIGDNKEMVFLDNTDIVINGYLDPSSAERSQLEVEGLSLNGKFLIMAEQVKKGRGEMEVVAGYLRDKKATPGMAAALTYLVNPATYEDAAMILDMIDGEESVNVSHNWLKHYTDSMSRYRIGGPAPDFDLVDENNERVRLSDLRGKYILLDFWASWCGPCKFELKNLKNIYKEFGGRNIEFVSISLDNTKDEWFEGLESERIPWITLWDDKSGGFNLSPLKEEYGFNAIPFIVLIDPEGKIIARRIRGEAIARELNDLNL